ncbi:MAG: family 43 glycosylhydrolase [Faecalicatena sp.]|uniref:family 43 glycosylhydrolase n=1 Tax=Faecalicatena sp. TaxID=2005360 RepID=UPI0025842C66|nr:family 43 glycosylhydrolase [Faecalicatena sp.]MCI6465566.1 family 43 glycosylhydrolase [Faecalicatena sp.]MDY5617398.1 family 43 glycosylhydrolase [Lachnospiraceae bacterium]
MRNLAFNPYLPSWEYVPDGEPHVFNGRVYVYGSHDRAHGTKYCEEDYVVWSAPVDDLSTWKYEGVSYRKSQDAANSDGTKLLFAPDVACGPDGRYYLYYGLSDIQYIGVAVSDSPSGPFLFYGHVQYADGSLPAGLAFDPGILVDEDGIYLYYGISPKIEGKPTGAYSALKEIMPGAYMIKLDKDMKTAISDPVLVANGYCSAKGTGFEEHPFFEASSIRKVNGRYYFIYSSLQGHELCYATADAPEGPFTFGGVIVSNGDVGLFEEPTAYMANNHGSIECVDGQYYIFYHRHTHGRHFSRQACAEKIQILEDGRIPQVEITSCGLNEGPLPAAQRYPSYIICNLHGPSPAEKIPSKPPFDETMPYLTETEEVEKEKRVLYLTNMQKQAACGVKYLQFEGETSVRIKIKGARGTVKVLLDSQDSSPVSQINVDTQQTSWTSYTAELEAVYGKHAVYFLFEPEDGAMDFLEFEFDR